MLRYLIAGFLAGLISIGLALFFHLHLTMVVIVTAGLAAFVAGVLPRQGQTESVAPVLKA